MRRNALRPAGFDEFGLKRAFADRLTPALVAAMAFLAALALSGAIAAAGLAQHWRHGAGAALIVQAPRAKPQLDRLLQVLQSAEGVAQARVLEESELHD